MYILLNDQLNAKSRLEIGRVNKP